MSVFRPRGRRISLRLTEQEYQKLCRLCNATDARSVSDCARNAVRNVTAPAVPVEDETLAQAIRTLDLRLRSVAREIEFLAKSVAAEPNGELARELGVVLASDPAEKLAEEPAEVPHAAVA